MLFTCKWNAGSLIWCELSTFVSTLIVCFLYNENSDTQARQP